MDKQYSVEFFVSFIDAMQKLCRDYLHFEQGVELSGYLALEIDSIKKERYVLSEFVQSTGQVISESYCTKAFKTVKKVPERNLDTETPGPSRQSNNARWGQRNAGLGEGVTGRYPKPVLQSASSSSSSSMLHGRTHTITSSALEELTELEASCDPSMQPSFSKWPTHTGSVSRGSKRNTLEPLSDSPSSKKDKADPITEHTTTTTTNIDLSDTISVSLPGNVVIKDEADAFPETSADDSGEILPTENVIDQDEQSVNSFNTTPHALPGTPGSAVMPADEDGVESHFKNKTESPEESSTSEFAPSTSGTSHQNTEGRLSESEFLPGGKNEDMAAVDMEFQSPGPPLISHLNYQSFMNSQFRDVKMHKCQHCDFRTEYQGNLKRHMRVHTGEFFHCSLCPRHFSDKYELAIHMQLHTGTITCRYCGEEFTSKNRRWEHERQHKRELPQM